MPGPRLSRAARRREGHAGHYRAGPSGRGDLAAMIPAQGVLVLDAGGVIKLGRGDRTAWSRLAVALEEGMRVVVPTPVIAQVHRGGRSGVCVDRVLAAVGAALPTSDAIARAAGELLGAADATDAVDAIVVAEALASLPAAIMTSDPSDLTALLDTQPDRARVAVIAV